LNIHIGLISDSKPALLCKHPNTEFVEPFQSDEEGNFVSNTLQYAESRHGDVSEFLKTIHINIPRKESNILLELHTVVLKPREAYIEWMDDNITYSEPIEEDCFYQGQVKGQERSSAALSMCDGLVKFVL